MDEYRAETERRPVPFTHLVTVAQTVGDDAAAAVEMLRRGGYEEAAEDREKVARDLLYARNWAEEWAPESMRLRLLSEGEAREAAEGLDAEQREYLAAIAGRLGPEMGGEEVQDLLYSAAVERGLKPKKAFAAVYTVLLGKKSGPKAGPFVAGLPIEVVRERFSV
jgi:lysyl-tRNA synthetase class 1